MTEAETYPPEAPECPHPADAIMWNPWNLVIQCHRCGSTQPLHEEVRRLANTVVVGECITFPNGLVIDKRPIFIPTPVMPSTPYRVNPAGPSYPGGIPYPTPNVGGRG